LPRFIYACAGLGEYDGITKPQHGHEESDFRWEDTIQKGTLFGRQDQEKKKKKADGDGEKPATTLENSEFS